MVRARRTSFAAPFVICISAAACGQGKPAEPTVPPPASDARGAVAVAPDAAAAPADAAVVAAAIRGRWEVARNPDGTCGAADDPCSRMRLPPGAPIPPCNPPVPTRIACPAADIVAIVAVAAGECHGIVAADCLADARATCPTVPTRPTPCPAP